MLGFHGKLSRRVGAVSLTTPPALALALGLLAAIALIAGCGSDGDDGPAEPVGIAITLSESQVQLTQTVTADAQYTYARNGSPDCHWYVDGVLGGSAEKGTITQTNPATYTAPPAIPAGGSVEVKAVSISDSTFTAADTLSVVFTILYVDDASGVDAPQGGTWVAPLKTIGYALEAADTGDTVLVIPGTYTGGGNRDLDFAGDGIVLKGSGGSRSVTIDCENDGRAFRFHSGEDATAVVQGLTVTRGAADHGGAIDCDGSSPKVIDCIFVDNTVSGHGGAIRCDHGSSPSLSDCLFSGNSANIGSGLSCLDGSSPTLTNCTLSDNTGSGSVYCDYSSPNFIDCTYTNNSGRYCGGVYCYESVSEFTGCLFAGNSATGSQRGGGALYCDYADPVLMSCTFSNSDTEADGGTIHCREASPTFTNCIIAFDASGPAVDCDEGTSNSPVFSCSDVYGNAGGDWVGCIAGQQGVDGNISEDPLFCDEPGGDFTISAASPCAAANSAGCGLVGAREVRCSR